MNDVIRNICAFEPLPVDPSLDWIELMPVGDFRTSGRDRRGVQPFRFDPEDVAAVIARSMSHANNNELMIDFDHRSLARQTAADTRAAGWIRDLRLEGDRVMASVQWTPDGRAALEGRSYRFISPVFKNRRSDGRVILIEGAGLVNDPALPQLRQLASLASKEMDMNPIEEIAGLLGLPADKPEDIVARVTALKATETQMASIAKAADVTGEDAVTQICTLLKEKPVDKAEQPDPAKFVPIESFKDVQTQLASLQSDVMQAKVGAAMERARDAGKLTPGMEDWATQLASKDLGEFEAWEKAAPVVVNLASRQLAGRVAPAVKSDKLDPYERQMASMMGVSEEDFLKTRNAAVQET